MTTIICDLGGVYFTDGTPLAAKKIAARYDLKEKEVYEVLDDVLGTKYREGSLGVDEFWTLAKKELDLDEDSAILNDIWLSSYEKVPEVAAFLRELRESHKVFFLSDNTKERVGYLEGNYSFLSDFDGGVFSHEVGVRKPDPKIYLAALDVAQTKPEECIYIDNKEPLLVPAKELGMRTIHFQNVEQFKKDLARLLDE